MTYCKNLCVLCLVVLFLSACGTTGGKKHLSAQVAKPECKIEHQELTPAWVSGSVADAGYFYGVGSSPISFNHGRDLDKAMQQASADLSSSIKTTVSKIITSRVSDSSGLISEDNDVITRSTTETSLSKIKRVASWRDGVSCQLWVQVRVDEATVKQNLARIESEQMLKRAETLFDSTDNISLGLAARTHNIEMAVALIADVRFELLPMVKREFYQGRYDERFQALYAQAKSKETLVLINTGSEDSEALKLEIARIVTPMVKGSWHKQRKSCSSTRACLKVATNESAKRLVLVTFSREKRPGSMGSQLGSVNISIALYDVKSGKGLGKADKAKGEVLSFDDNLDWNLAVQRAFEAEPIKIALKQYGSCTVETC